MSAAEALQAAWIAGVEVTVNGKDLSLEATSRPPESVLTELSRNKAGIVALLRAGGDGWSVEDWQVYFDERAGIAEFDGGLPRPEAEARAFECCVVEWLSRNFERLPPGSCCACGDSTHEAPLRHGVEPTGYVWLHSRCWPAWHAGRKADALAALKAMGIQDRSEEI